MWTLAWLTRWTRTFTGEGTVISVISVISVMRVLKI